MRAQTLKAVVSMVTDAASENCFLQLLPFWSRRRGSVWTSYSWFQKQSKTSRSL